MLKHAAIVVLACATLALPAAASATPADIAATHAYLQANYALARASIALIGRAQANIVSFRHRLAAQCPKAGRGSPQNDQSHQMAYEVASALWSIAYGTAARPITAFVGATRSLRWSSPKITRAARNYSRSLRQLATLRRPDLCADIAAWRASGFLLIPPSTARLDVHVEAIEVHPIPVRLLAPYLQSADRSIIARTAPLETKLAHTEGIVGQDDWDALLEVLALNQ
jgi:hypothetical protein